MPTKNKSGGDRLRLPGVQMSKRLWAALKTVFSAATDPFILVQNSFDIVIVLESDTTFRYINPSAQRALAYKAMDLLGRSALDYIHPEDAPLFQAEFNNWIKRPGISTSINLRIRHANGSWINFEAVANNLLEESTVHALVLNCRNITEQERAIEELRGKEEKFRTTFQKAVMGMVILNIKQQTVDINPAMEQILGYSAEELRGMVSRGYFHQVSIPADKDLFRETIAGKRDYYQVERKYQRKNRENIWVRQTVSIIRGENGEPHFEIVMLEDITERKATDDALRRSQIYFRLLVNSAADIIWSIDREGRPTYVSPSVERMLGYKADETIDLMKCLTPTSRELLLKSIQKQLTAAAEYLEGPPRSMILEYIHKDGSGLWAEVITSVLRDEEGMIIGILGVTRNVTERTRMEKALQESEQRFRLASQMAKDQVYERDARTGVATFYGDMDTQMGYKPHEFPRTGAGWSDFIHPEDVDKVVEQIAKQAGTGETFVLEYRLRKKDGTYKYWIDRFTNIWDDKRQQTLKIVGVATDITESKLAEQALRESEAKFRLTFENARDAIFWADSETGLIVNCNKAAENLLGKQKSEIIGFPQTNLHPPQTAEKYAAVFREHIQARGAVDAEAEVITKSGQIKNVLISASLVTIEGKTIIQGMFHDITERKKMEEALRKSETSLRMITDNTHDLIAQLDAELVYRYASPSYKTMLGYEAEDIIGLNAIQADQANIHPDDMEATTLAINENMSTLLPGRIQYRLKHKDGHYVWLESQWSYLLGQNGEMQGVVIVSRDITERKKIEEALRQSEKKYRMHFENVSDVIYSYDHEFRILDVSPSVQQLLGYSPEELIGRRFTDIEILAPEFREIAVTNAIRLLAGEHVGTMEYIFIAKDGSRKYGELTAAPLLSDDGKVLGIIAVGRDINERKKMEETLRESEANLRMITDNTQDLIAQLDAELVYRYLSPSYDMIFGDDTKRFLGRNALEVNLELIHPDDLALTTAFVNENVSTLQPARTQFRIKRADGSYIWLESQSDFQVGKDGKMQGVVIVSRDITERKKMEQELLRLSDAIRISRDGFVLTDSEGSIIEANHATAEMHGFENRADIIGKLVMELIPPEDVEMLTYRMLQELPIGPIPLIEFHGLKTDGSKFIIEASISWTKDEKGEPTGYMAVTRDISERKKAEEALLKSETLYRLLADNSGDLIWTMDLKGDITYVSPSVKRLLGYSADEMMSLKLSQLLTPASADIARKALGDRLADKASRSSDLPLSLVIEHVHKNGSTVWAEVTMTFLRNEKGRLFGFQGVTRDITERKLAEDALRRSEENYRALVDTAGAAGEGIMIIERDESKTAHISFVNNTLASMLGYEREEMLGMPGRNLFLLEDQIWLRDRNKRKRKGQIPSSHYGVMAVRKDGSMLPIEISLGAMIYQNKSATVVFVRDVTEHKQALDNLKSSEERFRSLIENASDVVLVLDKDLTITYESPSVERVLGYKLAEVVGQPGLNFIHSEDIPKATILYNDIMQQPGGIATAVVRVRHKNGSLRLAEAIGRNFLDNPSIAGIVVNFRDVTEREMAHVELERHAKRVEALHSIAQAANQTLDMDEFLDTALQRVTEVMDADAGCLYLLDTAENVLALKSNKGISKESVAEASYVKLGEETAQRIINLKDARTPLIEIFDKATPHIRTKLIELENIQSFAVVPLTVKGQFIGMIAIGRRTRHDFEPSELDLLDAVCNQIGVSVQNSMLYEEVRGLIGETLDAQEKERERVCLEVHDGVAQTLVSAFQYLQTLEATLPDGDKAKTEQLLSKATVQVKRAIQETRDVINSLQPATLSDLGLVATLRQEMKRLGQETGLKIDFKAEDIRLPKDIESGLYRIIHEAVSNARRHSNTKSLRIRISSDEGSLKVEVRDWGKGFDQTSLSHARRRGTGLFSIRKRAELLKGTCDIQSKLGEGTTVRVEIPLSIAEQQ